MVNAPVVVISGGLTIPLMVKVKLCPKIFAAELLIDVMNM